jgi:hypothetical protein
VKGEVFALLFPEPNVQADSPNAHVMAVMLGDTGIMELRRVRPDRALLNRARIAGRLNCGKPIVDPFTREVIGCEIEPLALSAG